MLANFVDYLIAEFDALTGSKISSIDIGARVVRMEYSPTSGRTIISILEVFLEHTFIFKVCISSSMYDLTTIFCIVMGTSY